MCVSLLFLHARQPTYLSLTFYSICVRLQSSTIVHRLQYLEFPRLQKLVVVTLSGSTFVIALLITNGGFLFVSSIAETIVDSYNMAILEQMQTLPFE